MNSEQFQDTIHRFIELYGDRTEGIGDEIHAGLAWIEKTQFVLIARGETTALQPPSWRRVSRLFDFAQQFRRPILLWDVPFQVDMTGSNTLLHRSAAQSSRLSLLKLTVPIIGVFETLGLEPGFAPIDAAVLLQQRETDIQRETSPILVKVANNPSHLRADILELLSDLSTLPVEKLIDQRLKSIRQAIGDVH
ncbi:hypothetical protein F4X33_11215 [Candidatus Poribacteria bacterium]|nr:hypothetical protein [Candidatus Poribacteria bacterium]